MIAMQGLETPMVKKRRGRPEKAVEADFGPVQRLLNGSAVVAYRTDPEAPNRPAIRAAGAKVIYHQLWVHGFLTDEEHEAADRYLMRLEMASGARDGAAGVRIEGSTFQGPSEAQLAASTDLRFADAAIGQEHLAKQVATVIGWNIWPSDLQAKTFKAALHRMADAWGM